jgi:sodium-dependent dicarboxylate transporter 2/3/5
MDRMPRRLGSSFASPLPDSVRRPLATVLLFVISAGLAWSAYAAGWPREQWLIVGILTWTVLLWMTETLPLFATAFISFASQLILLGNPGGWTWLGFENAEGPPPRAFLNAAVDPVLLLFFGGLVLSRAVTTSRLDARIAAQVLRPMSGSPSRLLLGVILTTSCFSLLMSNTATTALMLALIAPVLAQGPPDDPFRKALLLAVPVSANVTGMSTPIASPPNAIAVSYLARENVSMDFVEWMLTAVPIVIVLLAITWWRLQRLFPPTEANWRIEFPDARLTRRGALVMGIAIVTFACWVTEPLHGVPASVVAMLPVTLLFATGSFTREDVNSLDWDVLILIAGGLTLGYSLQVTGLDGRLAALVPAGSRDLARVAVLVAATIGLGTFFSNTAIASMLMR